MNARLPRSALAAALTTAALTVSLTACGTDDGSTAADPSTGSTGSTGAAPASSSSPTADSASASATGQAAYAVYDVGDTPQGPRLFREFRSADGTDTTPAALAALGDPPADPDYRTLWSSGALSSATVAGDRIDVVLSDQSLSARPQGMSAKEARTAVQQVVYTVQASEQQRLPVQFVLGGAPAAQVLGLPATEPIAAGDELETLALVNITTPEQGQAVSGAFTASGVASTFEGSVPWTVLDSGGQEVLHGSAQTEGDYTSLTPWHATVDATTLPAGDYTFVASTGDSGEGPGPTRDTKAFTVS